MYNIFVVSVPQEGSNFPGKVNGCSVVALMLDEHKKIPFVVMESTLLEKVEGFAAASQRVVAKAKELASLLKTPVAILRRAEVAECGCSIATPGGGLRFKFWN